MVCFGVAFVEWWRGVVCGERNDVNHFWWEVLACGIRKTNWERRAKGRVGGEARWSGRTVVVERQEGSWRFQSS